MIIYLVGGHAQTLAGWKPNGPLPIDKGPLAVPTLAGCVGSRATLTCLVVGPSRGLSARLAARPRWYSGCHRSRLVMECLA